MLDIVFRAVGEGLVSVTLRNIVNSVGYLQWLCEVRGHFVSGQINHNIK